jgi:gas vesicle protein
MNRALGFSLGIIVGVVAGFGIGILFVPTSGAEMQAQFRTRIEEVRRAGEEAAQARRIELQQQLDELTKPA